MKTSTLAASFFLAGLGATACHNHPAADSAPAPSAKIEGNQITLLANTTGVATAAAQEVRQSAESSKHFNGRLVWNEEATVRVYSPVGGRVRAIIANFGDIVSADGPLARIDSPDFGQAQAEARKADADRLLASHTLDRLKELFAHGAAPQKDLEAAEDAVASAEAEQQRAASRLELFGATKADVVGQSFILRSPLPGTVVERNINLGQELRPDLMLANSPQLLAPQFVISDPSRLWLLLDVTETSISQLKPGQRLKVTSRALPGTVFSGELQTLGSSLDAATRTIKARGLVDNFKLLLKAEMYVDVEVEVGSTENNAVEIGSTAIVSKEDRNYVFVQKAPNVFERREVQISSESAGKVYVGSGVRAGEIVLIEGSLLVEGLLEAGGPS